MGGGEGVDDVYTLLFIYLYAVCGREEKERIRDATGRANGGVMKGVIAAQRVFWIRDVIRDGWMDGRDRRDMRGLRKEGRDGWHGKMARGGKG